MRLVSYEFDQKASYGIALEDGIVDLKSQLRPECRDLRSLLEFGLLEMAQTFTREKPDISMRDIRFLPPIPNPAKIIGVGKNYGRSKTPTGSIEHSPTLFIRFADSQTGHLDTLVKPAISSQFDYEGEIAVVIGRTARAVPARNALDYVAGYSCYMDGSIRDWQHSWFTAGKNWPRTASFGPWIVTTDEIPDPRGLKLQTRINGTTVQNDTSSNMIDDIPRLVEYISTFTELSPGDVILSGTPQGTGRDRNPTRFLGPGDQVEVEVDGIGCLCNTIHEDQRVPSR